MVDPMIGIEILLDEPFPALWDSYSMRETMRFLRKRGKNLTKKDVSRLLKAILAGPPRKSYRKMSNQEWKKLRDHAIRLRLFKLKESGVIFPKSAQKELDRIQQELPWKPRGDQSEEFPFFTSTGWGNGTAAGEMEDFANMSLKEFRKWARKQKKLSWDCAGGWTPFCEAEPDITLRLLKGLAEKGEWFNAPWYDALSRFRERGKKLPKRHKQETALLLLGMPTVTLAELGVTSAWWFELVRPDLRKNMRLRLWGKIWESSLVKKWEGDYGFDATLNHAGGVLASVLMDELAQQRPAATAGENPGIPKSLQPFFKMIRDGDTPSAKLARIRLSGNLLYLFRIDRAWTENTLLQRMDPANPAEFEAALWEGYLWSPRIHGDLLEYLKPMFFRILEKLDLISERVRAHAPQLFIVIAVPPDRGVSTREAQEVLHDMPTQRLAEAAWMLKDMLSSAGDKASVLWRETIGPWFTKAWPKHEQAKSEEVSRNLAWTAVEAGNAFPDAVATIENSLQPEKWGHTLLELKESGLHKRFPDAAWRLIYHVVGDDTDITGSSLSEILDEISQANPAIAEDDHFKRLRVRAQ